MALYHLHVKLISRAKGRSAIAAAAYRRADKLFDERLERTWDFQNKPDVIYREILIPEQAPAWAMKLIEVHANNPQEAAETLWNKVEASEKRKDAQVAREMRFALPIELTQEQNITLTREFIRDQVVMRGMIADVAVHWDAGNPHVHVMLTTRKLAEQGFEQKEREWNHKTLLKGWREQWAAYVNFHLQLHQHDVRVDHRSYEAQGIELIPTVHQGRAVADMTTRGIATERMHAANTIRQQNLKKIAAQPSVLFDKITAQQASFTKDDVVCELGRYINDKGAFVAHPNKDVGILAKQALSDNEHLIALEDNRSVLTPDRIATMLASIEQHESVFTERDLAKALEPYTQHAAQFTRALLEIRTSDQLLYLGPGEDGRDRFTTRKMFQLENDIQRLADAFRESAHRHIPKRLIEKVLISYQKQQAKQLTSEQKIALKHLLKGDALSCLIGRAGTGKSFLLGAARAVWEAEQLRVHGVALSGIAADGLSKDAGIASRTIESFNYAIQKKLLQLTRKDVVVMDEAGMTDSVSLLGVLKAVHAAQAKLVLVGDPAQLQPVGPGATFRALLERTGFAEIQTVYRQEASWARDATVHFSAGRVRQGLALYEEQGCIHFSETEDSAMEMLIADWQKTRVGQPECIHRSLIIAHRNQDVMALNLLARAQRLQEKEIAEGYRVHTAQGELAVSVGERLLFLKNDRQLGVNNGRFALVTQVKVSEAGVVLALVVRLDGDAKKTITIDPRQYNQFTYGYAATVHKVQGITVDQAFVYAGGWGWNRHLAYVAATRHRQTCHFYANQETHATMDQLKKQFSRLGRKDSVLDFPWTFAERRGMETVGLLRLLPEHLRQRLLAAKTQLVARFEETFQPHRYWERKKAEADQAYARQETLTRREEARHVAQYVDANRAFGQAWEVLSNKMKQLGVKELRYASPTFSVIAGTEEYRICQETSVIRDQCAADILLTPERYQQALAIYDISLTRLTSQAERHHRRQQVHAYREASKQERVVPRDRLAHQLMIDVKGHYTALNQTEIDLRLLRQQAEQHVRRQFLISLTPEQREAFYVVEEYRQLSQQVGKSFGEMNTRYPDNNVASRAPWLRDFERMKQLRLQRDSLAYRIFQDVPRYELSLDFYQIGIAKAGIGFEKPTDEAISQAQARWYRLQQHAGKGSVHARVATYQQALREQDNSKRRETAVQIVAEVKAHHGAIVEATQDASLLWRLIRSDAKAHERDKFLSTLTPEQQAGFAVVEAYLKEKKTVATAWREIFTAKETQHLPDSVIHEKLAPIAKAYARPRDALASQIQANPDHYQPALTYYEIDPARLDKEASAHINRKGVLAYQKETHKLRRGRLARLLCSEPKAYHGEIREAGLSWKTIYQDARIAERQALFSSLSADEKRLFRLASSYQRAHRQAGRAWSLLSQARKAKRPVSPERQHAARHWNGKRDYLAARLVEQRQKVMGEVFFAEEAELRAIKAMETRLKLDFTKVEHHAACHHQRVAQVKAWENVLTESHEVLEVMAIMKLQAASLPYSSHTLGDWSMLLHEGLQKSLPLLRDVHSYHYAMSECLLPPAQFMRQAAAFENVKCTFNQLLSVSGHSMPESQKPFTLDPKRLKKIRYARRIARESQPLQGTVAERYLREHRGIQGKLPSTYRFHPAVWHFETERCYPCLVVIAADEKQQNQAIQAIYLDETSANKAKLEAPKLTHGNIQSAAVLVNAGRDNKTIAIAEGPETALSIVEANPELTVYATLGSSNFQSVPLSKETKTLLFCADNDGKQTNSQNKVKEAADYYAQKGIEVWQTLPSAIPGLKKVDFNDILKQQGKEAVRRYLENPTLLREAETIETLTAGLRRNASLLLEKEGITVEKLFLSERYSELADKKPIIGDQTTTQIPTINALLIAYVAKENELHQLVTGMNEHRGDPAKVKEYATQAMALDENIQCFVTNMAQHPDMQAVFADKLLPTKITVAKRGGFQSIQQRIDENGLVQEDKSALIRHLQSHILGKSQQRKEERDRSGRTH